MHDGDVLEKTGNVAAGTNFRGTHNAYISGVKCFPPPTIFKFLLFTYAWISDVLARLVQVVISRLIGMWPLVFVWREGYNRPSRWSP